MITTDWRQNVPVPDDEVEDIRGIAAIKSLSEHPRLLVFPHSFNEYDEGFGRNSICDFDEEKHTLSTRNILGFVGKNRTRLTIRSRFMPGKSDNDCGFDENKDDFFLHYMLQKVLGVNILDMKHSTDNEPIFDFMLYLFPYCLKKALCQGLYREYRTRQYNDSNVRGVIDIGRHIRKNIPFCGNVAYKTREYLYDNNTTQLIRHTIEHIRSMRYGTNILGCDVETRKCVAMITGVTGSYHKSGIQNVVSKNLRPVRHPFFCNYEPLRRVCLQILRHEKLKYDCKKDDIYGVLFDGAWLWEEYISIVMKDCLNHFYRNKGQRLYLFDGNIQHIVPDYLSKDNTVVADAKYVPLDKSDNYGDEKATAIYYKTVTYMYRWRSEKGFLLYPCRGDEPKTDVLNITETGGRVVKLGLPVISESSSYAEFCRRMNVSENSFIEAYRSVVS